jgi:hypothetical protein
VQRPFGTPWPQHVLGPDELARLAVYRAAVRAGFDSDWSVIHEAENMTESARVCKEDTPGLADLGGAA